MDRITEQDAQNIVALLDRVQCQGIREADVLLQLVNKLQQVRDDDAGKDNTPAVSEQS